MVDPLIWPWDTETATAVTVDAATTVVLAANPKRAGLDLVNLSSPSEAISLGFGNDAVAGQGKVLTGYGSSYHMGIDNLYRGAINAICASGGMQLAISEELQDT